MKLIPLTREQFAIVDDEDFEWLSKLKWHANNSSGQWRAIHASWNRTTQKRFMHHMGRMILGITDAKILVDHINRNPLDNRRMNLRITDSAGNNRNASKRNNCTSRFKGVRWDNNRKKWRAHIGQNGKIHLGMFLKEMDAAKAYNERAKELYGEFAVLNEIP